jgi:hypothetical protein
MFAVVRQLIEKSAHQRRADGATGAAGATKPDRIKIIGGFFRTRPQARGLGTFGEAVKRGWSLKST